MLRSSLMEIHSLMRGTVGLNPGVHGGECHISTTSNHRCQDFRATIDVFFDHVRVWHHYYGMLILFCFRSVFSSLLARVLTVKIVYSIHLNMATDGCTSYIARNCSIGCFPWPKLLNLNLVY
jgi:hypothetical protein